MKYTGTYGISLPVALTGGYDLGKYLHGLPSTVSTIATLGGNSKILYIASALRLNSRYGNFYMLGPMLYVCVIPVGFPWKMEITLVDTTTTMICTKF